MTQLFKNAARAALLSPISAVDTSLLVDITLADLFPVADTGADPVPTVGKDWYKVVLEDVNHNIEIVYVRTRTLGSGIMSNVLRGQEGTTARAFVAGSVVGLRLTALDLEAAIQLAAQATTPGKDLLWAATHDAQVQELGTPLQKQLVTAFTTGGTATAYTLTPNPVVTAYAANLSFDVTFHLACGASPTLEISGVPTPPNLVKQKLDGTFVNIEAGDIPINHRSRVTLLSPTQALVETAALVPLATSADKALRSYTATAGGTADAITATFSPNVTALTDGLRVRVTGLSSNASTTPTLAAGTTAATTIKNPDGTAISVGQIGPEHDFIYSAALTGWLIQSPPFASTTRPGISELATEAEVQTGTDPARVPSVDSMRKGLIVNGALVSTTSGTSKNVTGIPAWAKEIDIFSMAVGINGTEQIELRIGPSGGVVATGYTATVFMSLNANNGQGLSSTTGFPLIAAVGINAIVTGHITLRLVDAATNLWFCSSKHTSIPGDRGGGVTGFIALAGPLTQFTLLPTGASSFDAGQFGYSYR